MQWDKPPSCLDSAMERKAIEDGWNVNPVFTENIKGKKWKREPDPIKNNLPSISELVIQDLRSRKEMGIAKYGVALQPFNGRDALKDAYEEVLDLANYIRQVMYERDGK